MGGAFMSVANDATAAMWNPAGVAQLGGFESSFGLTGQTDNLNVEALEEVGDGLEEALEQISFRLAFESVRDYARATGEQFTTFAGGPMVALNVGPYLAINGYGDIYARLGLQDGGARVYGGQNFSHSVDLSGAALGIGNAAVATAFKLPKGYVLGVTGRQMFVYYQPAFYSVFYDYGRDDLDYNYNDVKDRPVNESSDDDALAVDIGLMRHRPGGRMGLVIRNVNEPEIELDNPNRDVAGQPPRLKLKFEQQVDFGASWSDGRATMSLEAHNLTGANDQPLTMHFGLEHRFGDFVTLRGGLNDKTWVGGLGLMLGPIKLDVATGPHYEKYAALGLRLDF